MHYYDLRLHQSQHRQTNSGKSSDYFEQNSIIMNFDKGESWTVLSAIEQRIKSKIEKNGVQLKNWNINIYRGILTGYNEAFIINGARRHEILANCKTQLEKTKTDEIIRPILRGRDIKKYSFEFADIYLISTFPSLKIDIENYPSIKQHLLSFGYDRLKQTGEKGARKKTSNKWFETQDSIGYWEDFSKQKIVWLELTDKPKFSIDNDNNLCLAGTFLLTCDEPGIFTVLSVLNSNLINWLFDGMCNSSGVGTNQWKKFVVERIPIPKPSLEIEQKLKILHDAKDFQSIEKLVYQIYDLSEDEILFIETF